MKCNLIFFVSLCTISVLRWREVGRISERRQSGECRMAQRAGGGLLNRLFFFLHPSRFTLHEIRFTMFLSSPFTDVFT